MRGWRSSGLTCPPLGDDEGAVSETIGLLDLIWANDLYPHIGMGLVVSVSQNLIGRPSPIQRREGKDERVAGERTGCRDDDGGRRGGLGGPVLRRVEGRLRLIQRLIERLASEHSGDRIGQVPALFVQRRKVQVFGGKAYHRQRFRVHRAPKAGLLGYRAARRRPPSR